jgi:octaprenyl-diphosphate synthase
MTLETALPVLHETAAPERVGDLPAARVADVRALVSREMGEIEELVRTRIAKGVSPGTESARHLFDAGGKRVRPLGLLLAAACFGAIDARARDLGAAAEIVHMATLLHDDVIDDGDQRRGLPTSRRVWGNAVSVLAGDMLLVEALRLASANVASAADVTWKELVATLGRLVDGEIIQLRGRLAVSLDEATYFEIVRGKTASLFEWALRAGARAGGANAAAIDALGRFGGSLGVAFQLVDDLLDYDGDAARTGKTLFADLAEGKVTLPLIHAASASSTVSVSALVARVRGGDEAAARELGLFVRESGACERVRQLARAETDRALADLTLVPHCPAREALADVARGLAARIS